MRRRFLTRAVVALAVCGAGLLVTATPAQAHAVLVRTTPVAGYTDPGPIPAVSLTFNEAITTGPGAVRIDGPPRGLGTRLRLTDSGRTIVVATGLLADGVYRVRWQVTASDGDVIDGAYSFAIGEAGAALPASRSGDGPRGWLLATVVLRWALFLGLVSAAGGLVGRILTGRLQTRAASVSASPLPPPRALPVTGGSLLGLGAAFALAVHSLSGTSWWSGLHRLSSLRAVSGPGVAPAASEVALFAAAAVLSRLRGRLALLALAPLFAVAAAEGVRGHLHGQSGTWGAALIGVHVAVATAWTGALLVVLWTAIRWRAAGRPNAGTQLVGLYAQSALVAYLVVAGTGTVAAFLILPGPQSLLNTRYGLALASKLVLFTVVSLLALRSRLRLRRAPTYVVTGLTRLQPRLMIAVLLVTAVLVSLTPPRLAAQADTTLPPPTPTGPVAQLGGLAGQLTVGVSVASGQLRVQVASPNSDDGAGETFAVSARGATGNADAPEWLALRPCGPGCFASPLAVAAPGVTIDLDVRAHGWHGGRLQVTVPWPLRSARPELDRALALLDRAKAITVVEQVTSDTTRPSPVAATNRSSGTDFLATEPYGEASSIDAYELPPLGGRRRLAFGVNGTFYLEMTLSATGEIISERLVSPNHLIERRISYRQ